MSTPLANGQADAIRMLMGVLFGDHMAVDVSIQPSESIDTVFVTFDGGTRIRLAFGGWHLHQPYLPRAKMTETEVALAFTEEVAAARLFVRDADAIYSRKITAAEFKAGSANLGPRRGALYVLLVGYDDLGRPSVILGGEPAS